MRLPTCNFLLYNGWKIFSLNICYMYVCICMYMPERRFTIFLVCFHRNITVLTVTLFNSFWVDLCLWCKRRIRVHSFACGYRICPTLFFILSLLWIPGTLVKDKWIIEVWIYFWALICSNGLHIGFYVNTILFFSFVIYFEMRKYEASGFVLVKIDLTIGRFLWFHTNFTNYFCYFCGKFLRILRFAESIDHLA